ncbi:fibronectin type III domain-containing protein [Sediminitomix flava]|uniref:Fibronectin type-III domain-containing protein n=1 Tax=Sediminitomix flava TaxID=379075 RepID=A0A315Z5V7_SEDFL|nr:fibronectin type III domain-containing protein [Sediminitomix flava]PWJ38589.1 hypothetical protein BC781_107179 [Sediminitomix flava]
MYEGVFFIYIHDNQAPSTPTLSASNITSNSIDLAWTTAVDDIGVTSYNLYRDGILLESSLTTSYQAQNLTEGTTYVFTVSASDAAGNESNISNSLIVITSTSTIDTCTDGIQNGDETGIDCGGSTCQPCNDNSGVVYVDIEDITTDASNTWNYFRIDIGDDPAFGGWYSGGNLRFETYGKDLVAVGNSSNTAVLGENVAIDAQSNFYDSPSQYFVSSVDFNEWNGKDGYIGFQVTQNGSIYYGWFHINVASDGSSFTITDYAYQTNAGATIYTGGQYPVGPTGRAE